MISYEFYAYYDEEYPSYWIDKKVSKQIASFLEKEHFTIINTNQLIEIINKAIASSPKHEIVIVFCQDVIPEHLLDNISNPTVRSPIRQFLNKGHSIVWLGDVPLTHVVTKDRKEITLRQEVVQKVLSLNPQVFNVNNWAQPTGYGLEFDLPQWLGKRPHLQPPQPSTNIEYLPLTTSRYNNQTLMHGFVISYTGKISGFIRIYDFPLKEKIDIRYLFGILSVAYRNPSILLWKKLDSVIEKVKKIDEKSM